MKNWYVPEGFVAPKEGGDFVLKVQSFAKGGYEATVRLLDLEKIGRAMDPDRKKGVRKEPEAISVPNQQSAAKRAKRKVRLLVRNMMASHLVTFTRREAAGSEYWTDAEWIAAWARLRRQLVRVMGEFPYVCVLEKHEKGNYHLHVAWCGHVRVHLVRKLWLAVLGGGAGCGNIDAKLIRVKQGGDRSARIASYISKYIAKGVEEGFRYNKKRYWASKQSLEEARRYVLTADTLRGALGQMRAFLGLDFGRFVVDQLTGRCSNLFVFPDDSGVWLSYIPELHGSDPPF